METLQNCGVNAGINYFAQILHGSPNYGGRVNIFPPTYMDNIHWIWVVVVKFVP